MAAWTSNGFCRELNARVSSVINAYKHFDCNNVEQNEVANELLFELIQDKSLCRFLRAIENDTLVQKNILIELENPINDSINLEQCSKNLHKYKEKYKIVLPMLEAIKRAQKKSEPSIPGEKSDKL